MTAERGCKRLSCHLTPLKWHGDIAARGATGPERRAAGMEACNPAEPKPNADSGGQKNRAVRATAQAGIPEPAHGKPAQTPAWSGERRGGPPPGPPRRKADANPEAVR